MIDFPIPVLGFVAWSGTGKTTLLKRLIPVLQSKGLRIALVKHAHHSFDIDHPGKDSHTLREAGAAQVVVASRHRIASIRETPENQSEPKLRDILSVLDTTELDLVLVEGFKMEHIHKVELHRSRLKLPYLYPDDADIIAVAGDLHPDERQHNIPCLNLDEPQEIARFVEQYIAEQLEGKAIGPESELPEAPCSVH